MPTVLELRQKRAGIIAQARKIIDAADGEKRGLTEEEDRNYNTAMDEANTLNTDIERRERLEAAERDLGLPIEPAQRPDPGGEGRQRPQYEFVSRGMRELNELEPGWREEPLWQQLFPYAEDRYNANFRRWLRNGSRAREIAENRALQIDSDTGGGYLQTPLQFVDRLLKGVDDMVYIRQWATIFPVPNAESLGVPTLENDPADADWTVELASGDEDSNMNFGRRTLTPHPLKKRIKVSKTLLRKVPSVEQLVRDRFAYKFGITWEKAGMTGSGAQQPLGVFTASSQGISTGRDVSTGNTTTEMRFDGLIEAKFTLKPQYWPRARWLFHRDGAKQIAKLKDGNGQYMWRESVRVGEPDRMLGLPSYMSEYAPNTFTTGLYVGILGDFSNYWIADAVGTVGIQRLIELYAETGQDGFLALMEGDGMPVLEEAFVRVKLA